MKQRFAFLLIALSSCFIGFSQTAPDFTFTDTNGDTHTLSDALAEGKVILLDFFFVNCGPCNDWAPELDAIIADYQGTNLEIWALSDRDNNAYISGSIFNSTHPNHFVGGSEGNGNSVINSIYANNFNFLGFPTYSVICTDGSITWDIWPLSAGAEQIRSQLNEACGLQTTSTYNIETLSNVSVYPNPAKDNCTVELDLDENTTMRMDLFNTLGQVVSTVATETYGSGKHTVQLDVSNLSAGLYNLRMQSADGLQSIDIVVE